MLSFCAESDRHMLAGLLALVVTAFFAGAATYVSVVEQPARLKLDDQSLLREWQPSYKRGAAMQASIALVACLLGLVAWWQTDIAAYLIGAILILLPWPWTLGVMLPTNRAPEAARPEDGDPATRQLIVKWGQMHLVRLALGVLATAAFAFGVAT